MLDSVKVLFNGLVSIRSGASVDIQAYRQIAFHVGIDLREIWSVINKSIVLVMLLFL